MCRLIWFLLLAVTVTVHAQRACAPTELWAGCGNLALSGTFGSQGFCSTCVCAASVNVTLRNSGRNTTLVNPFYPVTVMGGNQTCGWWTQGDENDVITYAQSAPLAEAVLFTCLNPGSCVNATVVCQPTIGPFVALTCSGYILPCDPIDVATNCGAPANQCNKTCHHAFAPTSATCYFNPGSCVVNASQPNPYSRPCTAPEILANCGPLAWISSCTLSTTTQKFTCVCNASVAVPAPTPNADFPAPTQCLSLSGTYLSCTPRERWRCGPYYTRGCQVRVLWLSTAAANSLSLTPNLASWFLPDPTQAGYFVRAPTVDMGSAYTRRVECQCSDSHNSQMRYLRSEYSPTLYAGPDVQTLYSGYATGAAPFLSVVNADPFVYFRNPVGIDNSIPTARQTLNSSANPPDLSQVVDQKQVLLNQQGQTLLEWHLWALKIFTGSGGVPASVLNQGISLQNGPFAAFIPSKPLSASSIFQSGVQSAGSATFTNPAEYLAFAAQLQDNYPDRPQACNGVGQCNTKIQYNLTNPLETPLVDGANWQRDYNNLLPLLNWYNTFHAVQPWFQWIYANNVGADSLWNISPLAVQGYQNVVNFAKPYFLNKCTACGGKGSGTGTTFFYGDRCSFFDCPGSAVFGAQSQAIPEYGYQGTVNQQANLPQQSLNVPLPYTLAYCFLCRVIANAVGGPCTTGAAANDANLYISPCHVYNQPNSNAFINSTANCALGCLSPTLYFTAGSVSGTPNYKCNCPSFCYQPSAAHPTCIPLPQVEMRVPATFSARGPGLCGNGEFNFTLGGCQCDPGWTAKSVNQPDCSVYACGTLCANGASCNTTSQQCVCAPGFTGPQCTITLQSACQLATANCSGHGYCDPVTGSCVCDAGLYYTYASTDCSTFVITSGDTCRGNGAWVTGTPTNPPYCLCDPTKAVSGRFCHLRTSPLSIIDRTNCTTSNGGVLNAPVGAFTTLYDALRNPMVQRSQLLRSICTCPAAFSYPTSVGKVVQGGACEYHMLNQGDCVDPFSNQFICNNNNQDSSLFGTCTLAYNATVSVPQKFFRCGCPATRQGAYCTFSICDNPALGPSLHDCNTLGNGGNKCIFRNASSYGCQCATNGASATSSNRLYQNTYCQDDVTTACGFQDTNNVYQLCYGNGQCLNLGAGAYQCQCGVDTLGSQCQFQNCPAPCINGACTPPSSSSGAYTCKCRYAWQNAVAGTPWSQCVTVNTNTCPNAIPTPDGSNCYCNDTRYAVLPKDSNGHGCTTFQCAGTDPLNSQNHECGPDFAYYNGTNTVFGAALKNGIATFQWYDFFNRLQTNPGKQCLPQSQACLCTGPFTNAPDGSCTTAYSLTNTVGFTFGNPQGSAALALFPVNTFTCATGYTQASLCNLPTCTNGVYTGSACQCFTGYTGVACTNDLCVAPRGARNSSGGCTCTNSSYTGPWCQFSTCANNGTWDSTLFQCNCPPAYTGSNCTFSVCGSLGTPVPATGLCNCSINATFVPLVGCVANPPPICLNGGVARNYSCACTSAWTGSLCQISRCGSQGTWNTSRGRCDCAGLWVNNAVDGYNCTTSSCAPNGIPAPLPSLLCVCSLGYVAVGPNYTSCASDCSNQGTLSASTGSCLCNNGYGGADCSIQVPFLNNLTSLINSTTLINNTITLLNGSQITNLTNALVLNITMGNDYTQLPAGVVTIANNGTNSTALPQGPAVVNVNGVGPDVNTVSANCPN